MNKFVEEFPEVMQIEQELQREKYRKRFSRVLRSTIYALVVTAAFAVLVATLWMPVLQIYGTSMTPTLVDADIVVSLKGSSFETGDVVGFYYGNKLLVKRCIAGPGDWIDITSDGDVFVNGSLLNEPYVEEKALGECDIELPYQVPENKWFLLGDHRSTSIDSRSSTVGCIETEQIVGKIVFRVWPFNAFGGIK